MVRILRLYLLICLHHSHCCKQKDENVGDKEILFTTFVSESDDENKTENDSSTVSTNMKSNSDTSGEENNSDFELFASQLRKSEYDATEQQMKEQTRLVIEEWIQSRVKFVKNSILQHDGIIAKVMMKKLPQYNDIKIDSDT